MRLKEYQLETLDKLDRYVAELATARAEEVETLAFLEKASEAMRAKLMEGQIDPAPAAWAKVQASGDAISPDPWRELTDGHGRQVPHMCLELPTGSGKTLIASHAVGRILAGLDGAMTGFVLWVVPSDAIYQQTRAALRDKGHPVRQALEAASGGRVKVLEKGSDFTRADVEGSLTVMLLMLQSARQQRESSEQKALKVFRESGRYGSFFPEGDDRTAAMALKHRVPNLETHDLEDGTPGAVIQSLGNTLKLIRPLMVLDEGHTAYTVDRRKLLGEFNPRFLLELTATPDRAHSNILVKIGGQRLRDAEMIKLPIELVSDADAPWQDTLKAALDKRAELERLALDEEARTGRFIRPILLVRVERTGRDQRDGEHIHTEDVFDELTQKLGAPAEWVRRQTAVDKELDDQLLSDTSQVRVIITKDALREGWDCPFAYVLALLSKTQAKRALTQMIGRVLRQPHAKRTGVDALDSAWVYCSDLTVKDAVESVRAGLDQEGMGDLKGQVRAAGAEAELLKIPRREKWRATPIFLPVVTHADGKNGYRPLDYERDVLSGIDWNALTYDGGKTITLDDPGAARARARFDYVADGEVAAVGGVVREALASRIDRPDLARRLLGVVPNPWVGMALVDSALADLRARDIADDMIAAGRLSLVDSMRTALAKQVDEAARALFEAKLAEGVIRFELRGTGIDWEMGQIVEVPFRPGTDKWERNDHDQPLQLSLFPDAIKQGELNGFERNVALYLDRQDAVAWWWRIAARKDWALQGWRRNRVYPDFLVQVDAEKQRMIAIETKGLQLDNDDTAFKRDLMAALETAYRQPSPGEVELLGDGADSVRFEMVMQEDGWQAALAGALAKG